MEENHKLNFRSFANNKIVASDIRLRIGDILYLHKDVFTVPAGRYLFTGFWGNLVTFRLGKSKVALDRRCLKFCTVEEGKLSKEEIFTTQVVMNERIEIASVGETVCGRSN